jgi:hypothetical protein
MKALNSGAIMGLDLIRRLDIKYLSLGDIFVFKSCFQKAMNYKIASLITKKNQDNQLKPAPNWMVLIDIANKSHHWRNFFVLIILK